MTSFPLSITAFSQSVADNPELFFLKGALILFASIVLFLLFFALRDILLRTRSFWYQFFCIVLVTLLPVVGFLLYLLIRPARTIKQRELESLLLTLMATEAPGQIEVGDNEDAEDAEESEDSEDDDDEDEEDDVQAEIDDAEDDDDDEDDTDPTALVSDELRGAGDDTISDTPSSSKL